jgi:hypothetical protein
MSFYQRKILFIKKLIFLNAFLFLLSPLIAEQKEIRVAFCQLDGFFEYDENGHEIGYGVALLKKLSEYTNYKFVYVPVDTWGETKTALTENKLT